MIVTVDEVKTHLRIQCDEEDDYLTSLITQAQAAAEDYCRGYSRHDHLQGHAHGV